MIEFADNMTGVPIFHDPIPISSTYTDYLFRRPGEYFAIKVDSTDRPHVVWTQSTRCLYHNCEVLDIFYAQGLRESEIPTPTTTPGTSTTPTMITTSTSTSTFSSTAQYISSIMTSISSKISTSTPSIGVIPMLLVVGWLFLLKKKKERSNL